MTRDRWSDHPCEALSALVDGELPGGERRVAVEAHLAACPACRVLKEDIELLGQAVAAETPPPMPADLAARIRGRIEASVPARSGGWWRAPWRVPMPAAAAAAVVVVALIWLAWPGGRPPGAPIPEGEVGARVASGAPDAPGAPDSPGAPRTSVPASAVELPSPQAPAAAPATIGPVGTAREKVEPKIARSTPAHDAVAGRSIQAPPVPRRDDGAPLTLLDAPAERDEARLYKEAAMDAEKDAVNAERGRTQGRFLEATVKQEAAAKSAATASNAPVAAAPGMPAALDARPAPAMAAAPITSPPLEAPPYVVRLLPDGSMSLRTRDYQCAVPIAPDDARLLATMGEAATAGVATRGPAPEAAAAGSSPAPGATSSAAPGAVAGGTTSAAMAEPIPVVLSPEARSAIVRLVRERYRAIIEERCGPLPR